MNSKEKKLTFSKWIILIYGLVEVGVALFTCVMVWLTRDLSPLAYLIPSVSFVGSTGVAFYFNKAKLENKIKMMNSYGVEITGESFDENNY